jgi:KaiC/GvpD/RAD55 family RecA-like ATPase
MGQTARIWEGLLQRVVEANRDIVGGKRLKGHIDRLAEKYAALRRVSVGEDGTIKLPEDFPEDDAGLMTVCTIIGALYWALDMFTGPTAAAERIRRPARDYVVGLPPGTVLGLNKFLPKLRLEAQEADGSMAGMPGDSDGREQGEYEGAEGPADVVPRALDAGPASEGALPAEGGEEGEAGAGAGMAAGEPADELAAQFFGTLPWLGEEVPRGCSLLVEGDAEAKEGCSLRFLGEGLEAGEPALALIAYSPEEFRKRMAAEGLDTSKAERDGRLRILDWSTFRERHIDDLEDEGAVLRLPMELPHVSGGMNIALQSMPEGGSPRAFVNILPQALATVAIETVFNFIQVTILKFKKRGITALFITDEQKDPEKAAIRLAFHSWVDIKQSEGGKLRMRTGGNLLPHKLKVLARTGTGLVVESEEAVALEEPEPELSGSLLRRMDDWRAQGYGVSRLEDALRGSPSKAKSAFDEFERAVGRARILRNELKILDLSGFETEAAGVREMLNSVDRVGEAEKALGKLKLGIERRKQGALPAPGKDGAPAAAARPAEAIPVMDSGPAPEAPLPEATLVGPEGLAGEEKRKEFGDAMENWRGEGFEVRSLEEALASDLESARRAFLLFRVQVQRLRELGGELASFDSPALSDRRDELARLQYDVASIPLLEKGLAELRDLLARQKEEERLRKEEGRLRRAALSEKLFWWSSHGLAVEKLEAAMAAGELAAVEAALGDFEPRAQRLLKLREELAALDVSDFKEQAAALESKLGDTDRLEEAESELQAFKEHLAVHSRNAKARRKLREKLEIWRNDGIRVDAMEKLCDSGQEPAALEREFQRFGRAVDELAALSQALAGLDARGFEDRAGQLKRDLNDPSLLEDCRRRLRRLQEDIARARAEEQERAAARARIEQWRRSGLQIGELEALVDQDIGALRKAVVEFQFELQRYNELLKLLEPLMRTPLADEATRLRKELGDFSRLGELEDNVLALLAKAEGQAAESGRELHMELERDLATREKLQRWINMGYHIRRLEGALKGDSGALRDEAERLENDIEQLSKTSSALEVLDTKGLERELAHIRAMLDDPDKLPAVRALTDSLRTEIARRKKEDDRRSFLRGVAEEWEKKGHDTSALHRALEGDLDKASQEFVLFHSGLAAAENLRRRLELLELFGFDAEARGLLERLRDPGTLEEVRTQADGLWKMAEERSRDRAGRLKKSHQRRAALKELLTGYMEKGLAVGRLEKTLGLSPDIAEAEFTRFDKEVHRLGELEKRLGSLDHPGFEREMLSLRALMNDVERISDIERGISELEARVEQARHGEQKRREELEARRVEDDRRSALRARLEERLNEWGSFGLNVEALRAALETDLTMAQKKFEEFENSLYRTEELRLQLHELQAKGAGEVPGAETVEKLLEDPLRLPQAERAFSEFRQRAEAALREHDSEMQAYTRKIAELREAGENVSQLERALEKGLPDVRTAFTEREKHVLQRDLQDTWKGIKSKLVAPGGPAPGTGQPSEGKIVRKRRKKSTQADG